MRHLLVKLLIILFFMTFASAFSPLDADADGYPDVVELNSLREREAFLDWFSAIAEAQYTAPSSEWKYRDCSGLIRFAYIEALKRKDGAWFSKFPYLPKVKAIPIENYPMPIISRSVFRVDSGSFQLDDVAKGRMVGIASAFELMKYSSKFIGKRQEQAKRGDLLFFIHPLAEGSSYHSMVYLGDGKIVYHTGADLQDDGEVRLLSLETLRRHPDPSWHPDPSNPNFLGFYRWKIVD